MKTVSIQAVRNSIVNLISPKKADKAATAAVKDGEKLLASAQDASAAQGQALVKPYTKPEMTVVKVERPKFKACSGGDDVDPNSDFPTFSRGGRGRNSFEEEEFDW